MSNRFQRGIFGVDDLIIGGIAATIIGGLVGRRGQQQANETNVALSQDQMNFQERMSSTAYQRATADMRAAGLNPALAYGQGGASTPTGSMAQVQNAAAPMQNSARDAMGVLSEVQGIQQSKAVSDQATATADKLRSETLDRDINNAEALARIRTTNTQGDVNYSMVGKNEAETLTERQRTQATSNAAEASRIENERQRALLSAEQRGDVFSSDVQRRKAVSKLTELQLPQAEQEAKYFRDTPGYSGVSRTLGLFNPFASSASKIFNIGGH